MKSVQFMQYTFGAHSSEPVSDALQEIYLSIARFLTGEECTVMENGQTMTVPSVADIDGDGFDAIIRQIREHVGNNWTKPIDVAVFDIARSTPSHTIRSEWEVGIAIAIAGFIKEALSQGENPLWIIRRRARPTENDPVWSPLQGYFESGNALVLDDAGLIRGQEKFSRMIDREEYKTLVRHARKSAIDLLQLKLIRRWGHIRVECREQEAYCARHFFDGSECKEELRQLIRGYIREQYKGDEKPVILYTDERCEWLRDVVLVLEDHSLISSMSVDDFLKRKEIRPAKIKACPLFIMPVIDTARTLGTILRAWNKENLPEPKILSVVSTRGDQDENGCWHPKFDGKEYEVSYLLRREREMYITDCPMCQLEIPHQPSGLSDQYLSLTSCDFWDMVGSRSCPPEEKADTPAYRSKPVRAVPPIRQIVSENGPWLAKKAVNLLEAHWGKKCLNGVPILHLLEEGAKPLPFYIRELVGATLIPLPNW
ncbi:MAG: hypothetical protein V1784_12120, partial [bacterium]